MPSDDSNLAPHECPERSEVPDPNRPDRLDPVLSATARISVISLYDPVGFDAALASARFSQAELINKIVLLIRDPDPKVSAQGITLLNQVARGVISASQATLKVSNLKGLPHAPDSNPSDVSPQRILSALQSPYGPPTYSGTASARPLPSPAPSQSPPPSSAPEDPGPP